MKSKLLLSLLSLGALIASCNGPQSVNKDLTTGAYTRGDGLGCNNVRIEINEKFEKRNTYFFGEKVNFTFNDLSGLKAVNGKRYPLLGIYIIKNGVDTILSNLDLLPEMKDGTDLFPMKLTANFVAGMPYKNNEKYKVCINISDRKGEGKLTYEMPFTIEESKNLEVNSVGIDYSSIYLWDDTDKFSVTGKEVQQDHEYLLILQGVDGLEIRDENVFPKLSVQLRDKKGRVMLANPNILAEFERSGLNAVDFKAGQVPIIINFTPGSIANPCFLTAFLEDQHSNTKLRVRTELMIK